MTDTTNDGNVVNRRRLTVEEVRAVVRSEEHVSLEGYTSFSSLPRLSWCPGSAVYHGIRSPEEDDSEEGIAFSGSVKHYFQHLGYVPDDADEETKDEFYSVRSKISTLERQGFVVLHSEKFIQDDYLKICGTPDLVMIRVKDDVLEILVIDYKFGWIEVEEETDQITGALLVLKRKFEKEYDQIACYSLVINENLLKEAEMPALVRITDFSNVLKSLQYTEDSVRVASKPACHYCPGVTSGCPEANKLYKECAKKGKELKKEELEHNAETLNDLSEILDNVSFANMFVERNKKFAKKVLESGQKIQGWKLKPTGKLKVTTKTFMNAKGPLLRLIYELEEIEDEAQDYFIGGDISDKAKDIGDKMMTFLEATVKPTAAQLAECLAIFVDCSKKDAMNIILDRLPDCIYLKEKEKSVSKKTKKEVAAE